MDKLVNALFWKIKHARLVIKRSLQFVVYAENVEEGGVSRTQLVVDQHRTLLILGEIKWTDFVVVQFVVLTVLLLLGCKLLTIAKFQ